MPTYDYQCGKCGFEFEREQRITEDAIKTCPKCKSRQAKRLLSAPNFILKGGGWYADGYGSSGKSGGSSDSGDSGSTTSTSSTDSSSSSGTSESSGSGGESKSTPTDSSSSPSKNGGPKKKAKKSAA